MSNGPATRLGMVRCEHCQRQFNPHSAARHIPWCKKQGEIRKRHLTADKLEALERYRWRIGYKPSNLVSNHSKSLASGANSMSRSGQRRQQDRQLSQATRQAAKSYREDEEDFREDEFSGDENSENDDYDQQQSLISAATQRSGQTEKRAQNGSNSSATFSSPSTGSIASLNTSVASTLNNNNNKPNHVVRAKANSSKQQQQQRARAASRPQQDSKLVRSVSSVTINKHQQGPGSASSRNSRVSAATIGAPDELRSLRLSRGAPQARLASETRTDRMRAKSVSDLSSMGEIVETLAKRMEEIYAQNQLLLDSIMRSKLACDTETAAINRSRDGEAQSDRYETDDWSEFAQCHHCRARCLVEANYCHKCGCKMRPSNPTPPAPE